MVRPVQCVTYAGLSSILSRAAVDVTVKARVSSCRVCACVCVRACKCV
jgi:hypothetical protein